MARRNKTRFDQRVKPVSLQEGDRVLVRNVRCKGKQKLEDKWERDIYVVIGCVGDLPVYVVRPETDPSRGARTLHRDLLLPCGFLPQTEEVNQPVSTPANRPRTRNQQETVEDPEDSLDEEDEERSLSHFSVLPTVKVSVKDNIPAQTMNGVPLPQMEQLNNSLVEESSLSDAVDVPEVEEEDQMDLGDPTEPEHVPELSPLEENMEFHSPVETSPNAIKSSPHSTETPVVAPESSDGLKAEQPVRFSSRQPKPIERLQYAALGKPLISVVQTLFHSLAAAYGETFAESTSDAPVCSGVQVV
ncbi:uncharacterized protein LOC106511710 [Austrofundulus limnaeus]|uniref:Uncharacterized protein LOC106511710 n=1 Tax=Austrofundulus limnaeus TaxID=52670 RepID=A0A2I4AK94_AUSLI|nr:PREDICTED: uncharacterized protein LOC106511710 [Austrofundulus limnaeus]